MAMAVTNEQKRQIAQQIAIHVKYMPDFQRGYDYSKVRLFDPVSGRLVQKPDMLRRCNDFLAATYMHSLALYQGNGDDCIDAKGNTLELKLAFIKSGDIHIGMNGRSLMHGAARTSLNSAINAKFKVHNGTHQSHHNQDTALILMSHDHNCYITGFILPGDEVERILMDGGQTTVDRSISLSQFINYGYEVGSSVPHIGWERYWQCLFNHVSAREGRLSGEELASAKAEWIALANPDNLKTL